MEFTVSPFKGFGGIEFGMAPDEVRARMSCPLKSFKRTPQAIFPCDYFEAEGAFYYYDVESRLEAAEFAPPASPTLNTLNLLRLALNEATTVLSRLDPEIERKADGAIAHGLGISIYASLAKDDPSAPVESVITSGQAITTDRARPTLAVSVCIGRCQARTTS